MPVHLRIHPVWLVGAGAAWATSAAGLAQGWPYAFEGGLLGSVVFLGAGLALKPRLRGPRLAPLREMLDGGAVTPVHKTRVAGTADARPGPKAPPTVAPTGSSLDPVPLELVVEESASTQGVPWARAEAAGPLMFEGHAPLASESMRRVWAARDPPQPARVEPTGVIHGVCSRCGTRISVANHRPVWATCPVCGHSKLLN